MITRSQVQQAQERATQSLQAIGDRTDARGAPERSVGFRSLLHGRRRRRLTMLL
jgi:hypothetical protein